MGVDGSCTGVIYKRMTVPSNTFVGSALQGRDIVMHLLVVPTTLGSSGLHYRNLWGITQGSTWASPYQFQFFNDFQESCWILNLFKKILNYNIHH